MISPLRTSLALSLLLATSVAAESLNLSYEIDSEYNYIGGSSTRGRGMNGSSVQEQSSELQFAVSRQLNRDLILRFGFEWHRFDFDAPHQAPLPQVLQQVNAIIGCDYQLGDQWLLRLEAQPGVYGDFEDISGHAADCPVVLGGAYLANPDLQLFFGLFVNPHSQYPILGGVGVRWRFADEWTLNLAFPKPRLTYDLNNKLQFYLGGQIEVGTYRVANHFGSDHSQPKLNTAYVDYWEIRTGIGCSWKISPNLTIDIETGYQPYRIFDFYNADVAYRSHGAPYGRLACHAQF